MSKVYVSSVHIKKYSVKTNRQFTYQETSSSYAHCSALVYITWGLIWDFRKEERENHLEN